MKIIAKFNQDLYVGKETEAILQIRILPEINQKKNICLYLIIDQSGSMFPDRIKIISAALEEIHYELNPQDTIHLISFGTVLGKKQILTARNKFIKPQKSLGGTDFELAFKTTINDMRGGWFSKGHAPDMVIFMSDGHDTESNIPQLLNLIHRELSSTPLSVVGLGNHYNEQLLKNIFDAVGRNGHYEHISETGKYSLDLDKIRNTAMKYGGLNIVLNREMSITSAPNNIKFNKNRASIQIPSLSYGDEFTVSLKVKTVPWNRPGKFKVGEAILKYLDSRNNQHQNKEHIVLNFIDSKELCIVDKDVEKRHKYRTIRENLLKELEHMNHDEKLSKAEMLKSLAVDEEEIKTATNIFETLIAEEDDSDKKVISNLFNSIRS